MFTSKISSFQFSTILQFNTHNQSLRGGGIKEIITTDLGLSTLNKNYIYRELMEVRRTSPRQIQIFFTLQPVKGVETAIPVHLTSERG